MPRLNVQSPEVQQVLDNLIPQFLAHGSVSSLVSALNDALPSQRAGAIHQNRIHTLLSGDLSRSVNEATLTLVTEAATSLASDYSLMERGADAFDALRMRAEALPPSDQGNQD